MFLHFGSMKNWTPGTHGNFIVDSCRIEKKKLVCDDTAARSKANASNCWVWWKDNQKVKKVVFFFDRCHSVLRFNTDLWHPHGPLSVELKAHVLFCVCCCWWDRDGSNQSAQFRSIIWTHICMWWQLLRSVWQRWKVHCLTSCRTRNSLLLWSFFCAFEDRPLVLF